MKELLCRMRLFSCGSEAEKGAIGQEVTGTSGHSDGCHFDEARPKTRLVSATTEIRRSRQRRRPQRCVLLRNGRATQECETGVWRGSRHTFYFSLVGEFLKIPTDRVPRGAARWRRAGVRSLRRCGRRLRSNQEMPPVFLQLQL